MSDLEFILWQLLASQSVSNNNENVQIEDALQNQNELVSLKKLASQSMSRSHDRWHIDDVLQYARELQQIHGGDLDVLTAAVILHDLGRADPNLRGQESADKSVEWARILLEKIGMPNEKINLVLQAIVEHDKPSLTPTSIEGLILKEADFLAGFGAWGIVRIAMWAAETKGGIDQILDRLENRMPLRMRSLTLPEAKRIGIQEFHVTNVVTTRLKHRKPLNDVHYEGKYIVIEGNSGAGKNTQAELLVSKLTKAGYSVELVQEPGEKYKVLKKAWGEFDDSTTKKFLYMADRFTVIKDQVIPSLRAGKVVVSVRSFISTLVYQCEDEREIASTLLDHDFVPIPDLIVLFDLPTDMAMSRVESRSISTGKELTMNENPAKLEIHRQRYRKIAKMLDFYNWIVADASQSMDTISNLVWHSVQEILEAK